MVNAKAVQGHWDHNVHGHLQQLGNELFLALFKAHPEVLSFFKFAKASDLAHNKDFQAQTLAVMKYLEQIVHGLGSNADDLMKAKAADHKGRHVGKAEFAKVFDLLPGFMGHHGADAGVQAEYKAACDHLLSIL